MCGRHSTDQCAPVENGSVERVTEVDAEFGGPSHPCVLARRPLWRCVSSIQFHTSYLNARRQYFELGRGGCRARDLMGVADAGVVGIPELDRRIHRVLAGGQMPDGFSSLQFEECELE